MNSTMSPYLMRKTNTRNKRRVSRLEDPVPTNVHNFNNNNMMVPDDLSGARLPDIDDQAGYYHESGKMSQAMPFNNVAHVIRRGQAGNNAPTGNEYRPRASLERKRR